MRIVAACPAVLALLLLFGASANAVADPVPQGDLKLLETMAFAAHQDNYSGTFIYQYGEHVETSRIIHVVDANGEHGKIESLDGEKREIIRNNGQVWCVYGNHKVKVEPRQAGREFPALLPEQLTLLNQNYRISLADDGRVAGFLAHSIIIRPKDNLRYVHKIWASSDSGLMLKAEVLDERGNVIEQYAFTQLDMGGNIDRSWINQAPPEAGLSVPASAVAANMRQAHTEPAPADMPHIARQLPANADVAAIASGWQVDAMPAGFKRIAEVQRYIHGRDKPVIQMVYSDGLAGISIFIEKADNDEDDHPNLFSQGIIQVYSKVVNDHLVTVVGEVPPQTVMQVADSVRYSAEQ